MDVGHPIRAIVPTLDALVLEVLAGTVRPLTSPEIQRIAGEGSLSGIRKVLARLVGQGVVHAQEHAAATFYSANRDHLAWPAAENLTRIRRTLLDRLRDDFKGWKPRPLHASLFGSTARGEGDAESDIDVLLIRPNGTDEDESPWADHVDELRRKVRLWTGNRCQAFQIDLDRLAEHVAVGDPLVQNWLRDSITLSGTDFKTLLRQLPKGGAG